MSVGITQYGSDSTRAIFEKFRKNQANISKDDLTKARAELAQNGAANDKLDEVIDNFDKIDTNGDGISLKELQTYDRSMRPSGSSKNSAALTKDQMTALVAQLVSSGGDKQGTFKKVLDNFDEADLDKDGKISVEEFQMYVKEHNLKIEEHSDSGDVDPDTEQAPPDPRSGDPRSLTKEGLTKIAEMITDTGGTVPPIITQMLQEFETADADGDGKIVLDEFKKFRKENPLNVKA